MTANDQRPRAIVFAIKYTYVNPMVEARYDMLSQVFDLFFYGPGYVAWDDLKTEAEEIFDQQGPFDAIFIQEYYWNFVSMGPQALFENVRELLDYLKRRRYLPFAGAEWIKRAPKAPHNIDRLPGPKFLFLQKDPHKYTEEYVREVEAFPGFIMTIYPLQVLSSIQPSIDRNPKLGGFIGYDLYLNFCARNAKRMIPFTHLIGNDEFRYVPIAKKKRLVCVPGAQYKGRQEAVESLQAAGEIAPVADPLQQRVEFLLSGAGSYPLLPRSKWGIQFIRWGFTRLISSSLLAYTDGHHVVRWPVRKFFEIPALGTLLAATPFRGMYHLGFEDGVHYIACRPSELPDIVNQADRERDWAGRIILQGQNMVRDRYTTTAYAQRFRLLWPSLLDGTYAGAEWRQGELIHYRQQPTNC